MNIPVICGSVRPGSNSLKASKLLTKRLQDAGHTATLVNFIDLPLPLVNIPDKPSQLKKVYPDSNVQQWSNIVDQADAFVFVIPEYNHGMSGVLKNALDWLYPEFNNKPAGLVGVSDGMGGGIRAVEAMRILAANFGLYDIRQAVNFRETQNAIDEKGNLIDQSYEKRINGMITALIKAAEVMKQLRT